MKASSAIVLLGRSGTSTRVIYHAMRSAIGEAPVILEDPPSELGLLVRRTKRYGVPRVLGQVLFRVLKVPRLAAAATERRSEVLRTYGLDDAPLPSGAWRVPSANSPRCTDLLRALAPRVVVVSGTRVLSPEVLQCVPAAFINIHAGITPLYRGVHGGYWALVAKDADHCGVTVHRVDEGIDTGAILAQARIEPTRCDNFTTYPVLQLGRGVPALVQILRTLLAGDQAEVQPRPPGPSRFWTHPTFREYRRAGVP